jgi:hypothetical protein
MGSMQQTRLAEMWNNSRFQSARAEFSRFSSGPGDDVPCHRCQIFDKPSFRFAAAPKPASPLIQIAPPAAAEPPSAGAEEKVAEA